MKIESKDFDDGFLAGLEHAYFIARGHLYGDGFLKHGTRQLYWKGRSDAATEIRDDLRRFEAENRQ